MPDESAESGRRTDQESIVNTQEALDAPLSKEQKMANSLELSPSVREVEWVAGEDGVRYYVTFDEAGIPDRFHEVHGLRFDSAWTIWEAYQLREYVNRRARIRASYWREYDEF